MLRGTFVSPPEMVWSALFSRGDETEGALKQLLWHNQEISQ